jgi:flagella basal body P-ring formation protein FlgA
MMILRMAATMRCFPLATLLLAMALLAGSVALGKADDTIATPTLRANVTVTSDVVRVGDVVDHAGAAAQIAIYRAPDPGTTGSLPVAQVLSALRARQVIGVSTGDIKEVAVTRLARTVEAKEIELQVARAIEHRGGLGDAANLSLTFDRDMQDVRLDASYSGTMQMVAARFDSRNAHFDVSFEIANEGAAAPTRLRYTGTAIETVEAAVLMRDVERGDILRSSDVSVERRPKAEIVGEAASRDRALGMQMRRSIRSGQPLKVADLAKPDLVQRDQVVTLIFQTAGLYLTMRGKALDNGTEGDVVNVLNLQSKRTVSGTVIGRGQVAIEVAAPRLPAPDQTASIAPEQAPVSVAAQNAPPTPTE